MKLTKKTLTKAEMAAALARCGIDQPQWWNWLNPQANDLAMTMEKCVSDIDPRLPLMRIQVPFFGSLPAVLHRPGNPNAVVIAFSCN